MWQYDFHTTGILEIQEGIVQVKSPNFRVVNMSPEWAVHVGRKVRLAYDSGNNVTRISLV